MIKQNSTAKESFLNPFLRFISEESVDDEFRDDINWQEERRKDPVDIAGIFIKKWILKCFYISKRLIKPFVKKCAMTFSMTIKFLTNKINQYIQLLKKFTTMKKSPILNRVQNEAKTAQNEIPADKVRQQQKRFQTALKSYLNKNKVEELEIKPRKYFGGLYH